MGYVGDLRLLIGNKAINLVATAVIVVNELNEILLQKRSEPYGSWGIPGGLIELGESTESAGKREVFEETGVVVEDLKLIGVFSGEEDNYIKLQNGDEYYVVLVAYYTKCFTGTLCADGDETLDCRFFDISEIPDKLLKRHELVIKKYLEII
ncbi:NUDIX domain-containing protein [Romboutsia sedimentorum]|uniref:NUDIX domain-containing protein n=1 Tax=Romboutsia sedimentorum TaxID=1368474 RepID=A0ABT7E5Y0_9FIRM|nr:NUDIX domain-containing protein [Romboutsia sedimentorum]MDK2562340.1 NUDIX domain-containing protein [Romboutsia sedimentorum]